MGVLAEVAKHSRIEISFLFATPKTLIQMAGRNGLMGNHREARMPVQVLPATTASASQSSTLALRDPNAVVVPAYAAVMAEVHLRSFSRYLTAKWEQP